jgi:hypothetical protein
MKKKIKRLVNKVLFKFGYVEYEPFERLLYEVVKVRIQALTDDF